MHHPSREQHSAEPNWPGLPPRSSETCTKRSPPSHRWHRPICPFGTAAPRLSQKQGRGEPRHRDTNHGRWHLVPWQHQAQAIRPPWPKASSSPRAPPDPGHRGAGAVLPRCRQPRPPAAPMDTHTSSPLCSLVLAPDLLISAAPRACATLRAREAAGFPTRRADFLIRHNSKSRQQTTVGNGRGCCSVASGWSGPFPQLRRSLPEKPPGRRQRGAAGAAGQPALPTEGTVSPENKPEPKGH